MDVTACYVYGFRDSKYRNTYIFDLEDFDDIQKFSHGVYSYRFVNLSYGFDIKPGSTATVEQENRIKEIVLFLQNKYKNTENLEIGYYVGVVSSDFDSDYKSYPEI